MADIVPESNRIFNYEYVQLHSVRLMHLEGLPRGRKGPYQPHRAILRAPPMHRTIMSARHSYTMIKFILYHLYTLLACHTMPETTARQLQTLLPSLAKWAGQHT